ncbi:MAG TPA: hypothetical protein VHW23_34080 [Kofleriaceae bacterium]|nr:hypothetical protein [Kofleriaceae bacterium]
MTRAAQARRILDRYLVEVVERHALCPWARAARERGELAVGLLWGEPALDAWIAEAARLLAAPGTRVAMVVAPETALARRQLATLRDQVAARLPAAGVAEFHPDAALDLATPARLVPFLRRSPDPMLQLVPLALIDDARATRAAGAAGRSQQARMLGGHAALVREPPRDPRRDPRRDLADDIAAANHATVAEAHAAIVAVLDDIAADRQAAYARAGISSACRSSR